MNRDFKVGLAVFIALVALGGIVFITGGALFRHGGNTFEILFTDAMGLEEGAPAYVSGLESGAVRSLTLAPEGVIVTVALDPGVRIPRDSRVLIGTGGLLGKPLLRIDRGTSPECFSPGERLTGEIPPDFDAILEELRDNLKALKSTFSHFNDLFGDPDRKARLAKALDDLPELVQDGRHAMNQVGSAGAEVTGLARQARMQLKAISSNLDSLTKDLDRLVLDNEKDIRASVSSLSSLLKRLDNAFSRFDADGLSGDDLRNAVRNISNAAKSVEKLAGDLSETFFDPAAERDGTTGKRLQKAIRGAEKILSSVEGIRTEGEIAVHNRYNGKNDAEDWLMDFSVAIGREKTPWGLYLAANELGDGAKGTFSASYRTAWGRVWAGLVRSDVGAGILFDLRTSRLPVSLTAEWWDEQGGSWAAKAKWHFDDHWGLFYERLEPGHGSPGDSLGVFYRF